MDSPALRTGKGVANMLRTLFLFEKYQSNIDDVSEKKRYSRNILRWSKNYFKSMKSTNGRLLKQIIDH